MRGVSRAREKSVTPRPRRRQSFWAAEGERHQDQISTGKWPWQRPPLLVEQKPAQPFPLEVSQVLNVYMFFGTTILFWEPKWPKIILDVSKDGTARLFITILFTLEKNRKQPKCPTVGDWLGEWSSSI